jgi:hypothetical protein
MAPTCPALVAPFITERVLEGRWTPSRLLTCPACAFRGFDTRFDETEMERLYAGYRGEDYFRVRHRWEPWYGRAVNEGLSGDEAELRTRKGNLEALVARCLDRPPATVLDYGGDRGQFIPESWGAERHVFEVSGRDPLPGIHAVRDLRDLDGRTFGMVMLCQVLEHLPEPQAQLEALRPRVGDGHLYVEVPLERPKLDWAGRWPWGPAGLAWLSRHPWLLRLVDLHSTFFRIRLGRIPPLGLLKASEHINFFTDASLRALMARSGYEVLACEPLRFEGAYTRATALGCLARPAPGAPPADDRSS